MTKKRTPSAERINAINLSDVRDLWPKSDDGRLCARLLQRYAYSLLVESSLAAECNAVTAQSEAGANKAIAKMVQDFATVADVAAPLPDAGTGLRQLNRFKTAPKDSSKPEDKK